MGLLFFCLLAVERNDARERPGSRARSLPRWRGQRHCPRTRNTGAACSLYSTVP